MSNQRAVRLPHLLPYLLYEPEGSAERQPLLLFLHGAGERGDDLELLKVYGPSKELESHPLPFIVISPQCPADSWWTLELEALARLLEDALARYSADPARIYLSGLSMGGYGAWHLAEKLPERFAALAPVCGGGIAPLAEKLVKLPIWAFHGAKDEVVPLEESVRMVEAVRAAGGDAKLTVYPEAGHDSWTQTYANPELYRWLLSHSRPSEQAT
jgi:predicted peptidase